MSETKVNLSFLSKLKKTITTKGSNLPDITGITLGEFHVDRRMNLSSGEADIYRCSGAGSHLGEGFVLKYYRRENAVKQEVLEKISSIKSPCVAPVTGYGEYEGHQYAVRPYYEMPVLSEVLAFGDTFSEEELKTLIIPSVITGLKALHDVGILHKDLKPANLIPDNTGKHVVLIDFGISSDAGKNTFVVTQTGMTPFYAAPEAMQGIFHKETDYYALGITVFELFTGFTPFQNPGLSPEEAARLASVSKIEFPENFPEDLKKLVLGLTYKDISHRNEPDNPNRRWGYNEVRKWLNDEDVPVPGVKYSGYLEQQFLSYGFDATKRLDVQKLVTSMLNNPAESIKYLGRGILTKYFGLFDKRLEILCRNAEEQLQKSTDIVQTRGIFYRLMYSLTSNQIPLYCGEREIHGLTELGIVAINAAVINDKAFCEELSLLLKSFLEYYASDILKSNSAAIIFKNANALVFSHSYTEVQTAWIVGYAFSEKRNLRVHDETFKDVGDLLYYLKQMETEKGFRFYIQFVEESQQDLEFFAACYPDENGRAALNDILDDLNRAVFGEGTLQFRNAESFDDYIAKLLEGNQLYQIRNIFNKYGTALKQVSQIIWKSSSYDNLKDIVSRFVCFEEKLFASVQDLKSYLENIVSDNQDNQEFVEKFVMFHNNTLNELEKNPEFSQIISNMRTLIGSYDLQKQERITVKGIGYPSINSLTIKKGDYITFGSYPQNADGSKLPIEWIVLDICENEALLISRYVLDYEQYHQRGVSTTWENCNLRKWLNGDFMKAAFSTEDIWRMVFSKLINIDNNQYGTCGGNNTTDWVFCLSIDEAKEYFKNDGERKCRSTAYAQQKGALGEFSNGFCQWWLRSPGRKNDDAARVDVGGALRMYGVYDWGGRKRGVRPAIRIVVGIADNTSAKSSVMNGVRPAIRIALDQ